MNHHQHTQPHSRTGLGFHNCSHPRVKKHRADPYRQQLGSKFFKLFRNSKLLTAIDLKKAPLDYIPKELGNLWHLKYLSLRETKVKALPNSIGRLCNLETLDLRRTLVYDLPIEINRLLKLQYLLAYFVNSNSECMVNTDLGVKIHNGIECMEALQKLYHIEVEQGPQLISELGRLTQLQKFGIKKLRAIDGSTLCSVLEKMMEIEEGTLPLLRELHLGPFPQLEELPNFHFLRNLNILQLFDLQKHFVLDLLPDGGHSYWKIKHIPEVIFWFKIRDDLYKSYKLGDLGLVKLKHLTEEASN